MEARKAKAQSLSLPLTVEEKQFAMTSLFIMSQPRDTPEEVLLHLAEGDRYFKEHNNPINGVCLFFFALRKQTADQHPFRRSRYHPATCHFSPKNLTTSRSFTTQIFNLSAPMDPSHSTLPDQASVPDNASIGAPKAFGSLPWHTVGSGLNASYHDFLVTQSFVYSILTLNSQVGCVLRTVVCQWENRQRGPNGKTFQFSPPHSFDLRIFCNFESPLTTVFTPV